MTVENWRGHVVTCAVFAFFCAGLSYTAYQVNSWGKWQKSSSLVNCLPLPPPLGCADLVHTREVLNTRDTDFILMCLFCCSVYSWIVILSFAMLASPDGSRIFGMEHLTVRNMIMKSFMLSVVFSIIICLIAAFRINAVYQSHLDNCIYDIGGFTPVYSISFYAVVCMGFLSFISSLITTAICHEIIEPPSYKPTKLRNDTRASIFSKWLWRKSNPEIKSKQKGTSRTTKQHIARNLLYPNDPQLNKMITFSSMSPEMEEIAADISMKAVMRYTLEEDIAENVKQGFEERFGPTWQCAVGDNFGSCVHHMTSDYVEVAMPRFSVLLYRCHEPPNAELGTATATSAEGTRLINV